jgi:hypothetical protein
VLGFSSKKIGIPPIPLSVFGLQMDAGATLMMQIQRESAINCAMKNPFPGMNPWLE